MAASNLLALIDDIASLLDDIAILTKAASTKTAGVLGDDLALNAKQVSGVNADRELPVVWAVAKGSFKNKLILVPTALLISATIPSAITPLLMLGGLYLCYEGFEKIAHSLFHKHQAETDQHKKDLLLALENPAVDLVEFEKDKIKGAIRTDFILSAEIIAISLGTAATASLSTQFAVLSIISVVMTVGVYGIVAMIVKMDDAGLHLSLKKSAKAIGKIQRFVGRFLLNLAPYLMKTLSIVGTAAMFMVGGGILVHGFPVLHNAIHYLVMQASETPVAGQLAHIIAPTLLEMVTGLLAGAVTLLGVTTARKFKR